MFDLWTKISIRQDGSFALDSEDGVDRACTTYWPVLSTALAHILVMVQDMVATHLIWMLYREAQQKSRNRSER